MIPSSHSPSSIYYSKSSFLAFTPLAVLYSLISNTLFRGGRLLVPILRTTTVEPQPPPQDKALSLVCTDDDAVDPQTTTATTTTKKTPLIAIVTGSNTGVGFETAQELVNRGYTVVLACRSRDKAEAAVRKINNNNNSNNKSSHDSDKDNHDDATARSTASSSSSSSGKAVFVCPLDLSSLPSVRDFSKAIKDRFRTIDVLVNNAGQNTNDGDVTEQGGLDRLFQTNFLGHFLLTCELMTLLQATAVQSNYQTKARIVNVSSVMHHFNKSPSYIFDSVDFWKQVIRGQGAADSTSITGSRKFDTYPLSKLAAILFTTQLSLRYPDTLQSIAVNPGSVNSDIWRHYPRWMVFLFRLVYLTPKQGCQTSVDAATRCCYRFDNAAVNYHSTLYLQPYWMFPRYRTHTPPFPVFEMLGPYCGSSVVTIPRLPHQSSLSSIPMMQDDDGMMVKNESASTALWKACEWATECQWP